jgi:hypothetical protein
MVDVLFANQSYQGFLLATTVDLLGRVVCEQLVEATSAVEVHSCLACS